MKTNTKLCIGYWSAIATTFFAIVYSIPQLVIGIDMPESMKDMIFILLVYFTVLTVTMPHMLRGETAQVEILRYIPKSFTRPSAQTIGSYQN